MSRPMKSARKLARPNLVMEPISLRVREASRFTGISRSALYVLIAAGKIEIVKVGRSTLIMTESLKAFIASRPHWSAC